RAANDGCARRATGVLISSQASRSVPRREHEPMKTDATAIAGAHTRSADFVALAKPRLNLLVVVSAMAGYVMGGGDARNLWRLAAVALGTGLVASGASAFNQIIERAPDALMRRTRMRPMPDGRLAVGEAMVFATILTAAGLLALAAGANALSALVALLT